jgi:hypothetical protein
LFSFSFANFSWSIRSSFLFHCMYFLLETGSHSVAQAYLEVKILLPHPPECWCTPSHLALFLFSLNLRLCPKSISARISLWI